MASGDDNRFSAIYTSIDGEDYEEYVEISRGPAPYLVPSQRGPPPSHHYPGERRPPPNKPMPLPRTQTTLPPNFNQNLPPRNQKRPATPANKMAETPLELGTMQRSKHRPPDHLPLLDSSPNIQGKLQPEAAVPNVYSKSENPASPPKRITGQKYSALSADAEVNEYASLQPLAKQRKMKLRERAKKKRNKTLVRVENPEAKEDSYNVNSYESAPARTETFSDSSRVVCILLSIIVVCLLLAIGSLITAVYTITAFEKYQNNVVIKTRVVNKCNMKTQNLEEGVFQKKCEYNETNSQSLTGSDSMLPHPLSCYIHVLDSLDQYEVRYSATLMKESVTHPYCMCTLCKKLKEIPIVTRPPFFPYPTTRPPNGTEAPPLEPTTPGPSLTFTCVITETYLGVK